MPQVIAQGQTIECSPKTNLRSCLLRNGIELYNGGAKVINCRGIGTCGTCAVYIEGEVNQPNWKDKARRSLPPHSPTRELRLACQTQVLGDLKVTKYDGFWGQGSQVVWTPKG
ncbi:2Fe-2S iron-sulfur cluster-binding protein [Calothrix sp. PCC 6303]|uniref:2Fe-2S iron-sulfur cluster-binding protein n=1 Tax=Calothrix sp. PCC 6303 TaxID=1170562 RepID=UPI0002A02353|nr:2Fe-2S iron-sulfur cluster-binding protein [Calothrix sp. PCC 6303]AFY99284.1 ferredoxin [Calothrix sp. PCC 6303]